MNSSTKIIPEIINVPQTTFAIAAGEQKDTILYTKHLSTCWAFMGVSKNNDAAFLCHLDTIISVGGLHKLTHDLKCLGFKITDFDISVATGMSDWVRMILSLLFAIVAFSIGRSWLLALTCFLYYFSTELALKFCFLCWGIKEYKFIGPKGFALTCKLGAVRISVLKNSAVWWSHKKNSKERYQHFNLKGFKIARVKNRTIDLKEIKPKELKRILNSPNRY
jgi:hypothetical protein